ncbi:hypothetical protein [Homoserinibacter sp. YIM 151385]|uniref:hypothetical protein n=1 Tax=Homoserinibacter sp. YIM 151385 TaxID=2985506 RepID=UPI0022F02CC1|nr:hypothetical protein [Homoserinibacter sp. YIM 151385]WBU37230.1 hypothetical protein OF852_09905 [Homoserinibacter sp. YIM 151385]
MGSSRKRTKELKRLKRSTSNVFDEQREVLDHANDVLREARRQLGNYARDDVAPRVRDAYDQRLKPTVASSLAAGRAASYNARSRIAEDVIPAVSGAIGSTLAVLSAAKDPRVREVVKKAGKTTSQLSKKAQKRIQPPSSSGGVGKFILLGLGVVAAAGVAYAAWQTLRADDDLWIEDLEESELTPDA